jgi:hypothetical protein
MANAKAQPTSPGSSTNWTLIGVVAIVAIAIVAIAGMMRPDSLKGSLGEKGPQIDIQKSTKSSNP